MTPILTPLPPARPVLLPLPPAPLAVACTGLDPMGRALDAAQRRATLQAARALMVEPWKWQQMPRDVRTQVAANLYRMLKDE